MFLNLAHLPLFPKKHFFAFSTSLYEILELKPSCSQRDIRKNYLRLAKAYHPDIYKGSDKDRFKQIKEAYDTLKLPEKRADYDNKLNLTPNSDFSEQKTEENPEETVPVANIYKDWEEEKRKMDYNTEYDKFMGKESSIEPSEVIISEDPLIFQMNENEKKRMEFVNMKNNQELYALKYGHQQGFNETLKDTISILNERHRIKTEPEELKMEREKRSEKRKKKIGFWVQVGMTIVLIPLIVDATWRRARRKKKEIEMVVEFGRRERNKDIEELHKRIVFEEND